MKILLCYLLIMYKIKVLMMNKLSQNQKLFRRLRTGKHITKAEAKSRYGIRRLAARIYDLREAGFDISTQKYVVRGGANRGRSVTAYTLVSTSLPKNLTTDTYWYV
jgi:hypothetical protein